jgi:hypothetical protein
VPARTGSTRTQPTSASARTPAPASRRRRTGAALAAIGLSVALAAGCSSSGPNDVVAAGPVGTNPETPAVDNPTTSGTSSTTSAPRASTTTTDPDAAASTSTSTTSPSTSATSVPPAVAVSTSPAAFPGLSSQIFWVRAPGDSRVIDIPGYRDPASGPLPLVIYGSVTNDGVDTAANPFVAALWEDASGTPVAGYTAPVLEPGSTTAMSALAPGQSGDVIVVVTDADAAARLATLVPELVVGSR